MYQPTALKSLPRGTEFLQVVASTPLKEAELSRKYGLVFEKASDDISATEVCVVKGASGPYFLVLCRSELPECDVAIWTARSLEPIETYAPRMVAAFIEATGFDVGDIEEIWPLGQ